MIRHVLKLFSETDLKSSQLVFTTNSIFNLPHRLFHRELVCKNQIYFQKIVDLLFMTNIFFATIFEFPNKKLFLVEKI